MSLQSWAIGGDRSRRIPPDGWRERYDRSEPGVGCGQERTLTVPGRRDRRHYPAEHVHSGTSLAPSPVPALLELDHERRLRRA